MSGTRKTLTRGGNRISNPGASTPTMCARPPRSEEHTSELHSHSDLVCRLLLENTKKKKTIEKRRQTHTTRTKKTNKRPAKRHPNNGITTKRMNVQPPSTQTTGALRITHTSEMS